MARFFNTTGICDSRKHYTVLDREGLAELDNLIARELYFVVHAPRQTGKSTAMAALARRLTESGQYVAVLVSAEVGAPFHDDLEGLEPALLSGWSDACRAGLPAALQPPSWPDAPRGHRIGAALAAWSHAAPVPLVLLIDEIDTLRDDALVSVLRQLRQGFANRPARFPSSVGLIGLRDVRDYLVASGGSGRLGTSSPFNIKAESIRIGDFTRREMDELLGQHTTETGQPFLQDARDAIWDLTQGQPWLVNALAAQLVDKVVKDRNVAIDASAVERARRILIDRRDTHIDSLGKRLMEDRVAKVLIPLVAGRTLDDVPEDDRDYAVDLGLVHRTAGGLEIANPIYREVIGRTLSGGPKDALPRIDATWLDDGGRLVPAALLDAFVRFWKQHADALFRAAPYPEVAPHLVMMAFLDRVANAGGTVDREFAAGTGRMDLLLRYGDQRMAFELKAWRDGRPDPLRQGLEQIDGYLARLSLDTGWLVVFDARSDRAPAEDRTNVATMATPEGRTVTVVRA